jgi:hypothetical protein
MASFRLVGLPYDTFAPLFDLDEQGLAARGMRRVVSDRNPGYPCRVSLRDSEPGEELLLLPYAHQPALSPYKASGPIYVRKGAERRIEPPGSVPDYVVRRLISVRAYDKADLIVDADVCAGGDAAGVIARFFSSPDVAYIHLHNARRGCFSCAAERA